METFCRTGHPTDDMAHAHCVLDNKKGYTYTHSQYVILLLFYCNSSCQNAPSYVVLALPVFSSFFQRMLVTILVIVPPSPYNSDADSVKLRTRAYV